MKPHTGAEQDWRSVSGQPAASPGKAVAPSPQLLDDDERLIVECLRSAPTGLTLRQLETSVPDASADVGKVLAGLVERRLVCSLNTLIPTYTLRGTCAKVHAK
jgi:hypothetical protein